MVLIILAIFAAIAVPRYSGAVALLRVEAAANRVVMDLNMAREQAKLVSGVRRVYFNVPASSYQIEGVQHFDVPGAVYMVKLKEEPYGVTITSTSLNNDDYLAFDYYGYPDSDGTIVLRVGALTRTVQIHAATGRITISG